MKHKKALITGILGQDGSYLAEFLYDKGYEVHGTVRCIEKANEVLYPDSTKSLLTFASLHAVSLDEIQKLSDLICKICPDEIYHLAGPSFVTSQISDERSLYATIVNSTKIILDTVIKHVSHCRVFFAGSAEMFGITSVSPQDLLSDCNPRSIYGFAKLSSFHSVRYVRDKEQRFVCSGILYNHESPRRKMIFLPRKVTHAVARIKMGLQHKLVIGNLESERDWGYAPDYVEAMWKMLQQRQPEDFIIATGRTQTVRTLVDIAFSSVGLNYEDYVVCDPQYHRPKEKVILCGNPKPIFEKLGWEATTSFSKMIEAMVETDIAIASKMKETL